MLTFTSAFLPAGCGEDKEELPPPPPGSLPPDVERWEPAAISNVAIACARGVTAASQVLATLPRSFTVPAAAPALPPRHVPALQPVCRPTVLGLSLPPEPAVEWRHPCEPSWTLFHLEDGPELENSDILQAEAESAERQLKQAQEMLSTAAASVAGALVALTREVVPPAR